MRTEQIVFQKLITALVATTMTSVALVAAEKKVDISKLPPPSTRKNVTYAADIKPIFDKSCIKCHGVEKAKAKLRLNTLESALKGSENGKVIEPGKSAESVLVHNIAWLGDEDYWMPPKDNKAKIPPLTKEEIGLVRAWIDQGAK